MYPEFNYKLQKWTLIAGLGGWLEEKNRSNQQISGAQRTKSGELLNTFR